MEVKLHIRFFSLSLESSLIYSLNLFSFQFKNVSAMEVNRVRHRRSMCRNASNNYLAGHSSLAVLIDYETHQMGKSYCQQSLRGGTRRHVEERGGERERGKGRRERRGLPANQLECCELWGQKGLDLLQVDRSENTQRTSLDVTSVLHVALIMRIKCCGRGSRKDLR